MRLDPSSHALETGFDELHMSDHLDGGFACQNRYLSTTHRPPRFRCTGLSLFAMVIRTLDPSRHVHANFPIPGLCFLNVSTRHATASVNVRVLISYNSLIAPPPSTHRQFQPQSLHQLTGRLRLSAISLPQPP